MRIYLDNAATTAIDPEVLDAMLPFLKEEYGNPSSIHGFGRNTKAAIEKARKSIAANFKASVGEMFFTSGGTESANIVIRCLSESDRIEHIITTKIEHHCVLHTVEEMAKRKLVQAHYLNLDSKGNINLEELETLLKKLGEKTLIALMHANNEIGTVLRLEEVANLSKEHGTLFFSDTVQSVAHHPIDLQETHVDFITGSAHKFHGPKGIGFVYINSDTKLFPLIFGGAQERNMRAGTENIYGIVGMAKALELAKQSIDKDCAYIKELKHYFFNSLKAQFSDIAINGNYEENSLDTVLNISFPKNDKTDYLLYNLDIHGIAVSAGSACTSGSDQGSHVLSAISAPNDRNSIRFSFSKRNSKEELDLVIKVLVSALQD